MTLTGGDEQNPASEDGGKKQDQDRAGGGLGDREHQRPEQRRESGGRPDCGEQPEHACAHGDRNPQTVVLLTSAGRQQAAALAPATAG